MTINTRKGSKPVLLCYDVLCYAVDSQPGGGIRRSPSVGAPDFWFIIHSSKNINIKRRCSTGENGELKKK